MSLLRLGFVPNRAVIALSFIAMMGIFVSALWDAAVMVKRGKEGIAKIVSYEFKEPVGGRGNRALPRYVYTLDIEGYRFQVNLGTNKYSQEKSLSVVYDPQNPEERLIVGKKESGTFFRYFNKAMFIAPLIAILCGVVFFKDFK